jgi:hypothetical protein
MMQSLHHTKIFCMTNMQVTKLAELFTTNFIFSKIKPRHIRIISAVNS